MTRLTPFSNPFLLGFDQIEEVLDRIAKSGADPYPPYNIERLPVADDGAALRITLAVAGFQAGELSVEVENSTLTIRGGQVDDGERTFLHRGIAARRFERKFVLADGIEVSGASLENGLLTIDLMKPVPARTVRRIEIAQRG